MRVYVNDLGQQLGQPVGRHCCDGSQGHFQPGHGQCPPGGRGDPLVPLVVAYLIEYVRDQLIDLIRYAQGLA